MDKISFSAILLDEEKYKEYSISGERKRFLRNLTQVNIFVGINNAGKSMLIRTFFSDEDLKFLSEVIDLGSINASIINKSALNNEQSFYKRSSILKQINIEAQSFRLKKLKRYP